MADGPSPGAETVEREKEIDYPHLAVTANLGPTRKVTSGPERDQTKMKTTNRMHAILWTAKRTVTGMGIPCNVNSRRTCCDECVVLHGNQMLAANIEMCYSYMCCSIGNALFQDWSDWLLVKFRPVDLQFGQLTKEHLNTCDKFTQRAYGTMPQ
jgi:hypothetical protein